MDALKLWPSLKKSALLGTARAGESLAAPDDAPQELAGALGQDREGALLSMLAASTSARRAGTTPPGLSEGDLASLASTCADDLSPAAPAAACARLRGLSDGSDLAALREWLALAREHHVRAPHNTLPNLLRTGVRNKNLRPEIAPVLGERGRWLASQNMAWKWAASSIDASASADEAERAFRDGEGATRADAFALLRALDAERAVQVLGELWKSEGVGKREQWVQMLTPQIGPCDEAMLERALDDRSDAVHKMAAQVLVNLPGSDFVRRSTERASKYLSAGFEGENLVLKIELPSEWDASWKRDGIDENVRAGNGASGQRTYWLVQMLGFVPPSYWESAWKATPPQILQAVLSCEPALAEGLSMAALRVLDQSWMESMLADESVMQAASGSTPHRFLLRRISGPARDALLTKRVLQATAAPDPGGPTGVVTALELHEEPWSAELTLAVLDWLHSLARSHEEKKLTGMTPKHAIPGLYAFQQVSRFAALMHLETLLAAPLGWPKNSLAIVLTAREILRLTAQTRLQMRREFESD